MNVNAIGCRLGMTATCTGVDSDTLRKPLAKLSPLDMVEAAIEMVCKLVTKHRDDDPTAGADRAAA